MTDAPNTRHPTPNTLGVDNVPFTPAEQAVRDILTMALGQRYAVSLDQICKRTGLDERQVKEAVQGLRLRHRYPVGSSRTKQPTGYFIIETAEELDGTVEPYRRQAITQLRVVKALMGPAARRWREFKDQLLLELDKEETAA